MRSWQRRRGTAPWALTESDRCVWSCGLSEVTGTAGGFRGLRQRWLHVRALISHCRGFLCPNGAPGGLGENGPAWLVMLLGLQPSRLGQPRRGGLSQVTRQV